MLVEQMCLSSSEIDMENNKKINKSIIVAICVVIVLLSAIAYMQYRNTIDINESYSAVFLTNGQVYFGQLSNQSRNWIKLDDVYYFQLDNEVDGLDKDDISLIKLGNELHGPRDFMDIQVSNILFIEELTQDSKVVQAIQNYQR